MLCKTVSLPESCRADVKPLQGLTLVAFDKVNLHIVQNLDNTNTTQPDVRCWNNICKLCNRPNTFVWQVSAKMIYKT